MPYQYRREPLSNEEADRLVNAAERFEEKLVVTTLLDTGLRVSELAGLTRGGIQWQERRLVIYGKRAPQDKHPEQRVIPMTLRVRTLLEHHFAYENQLGMSARTIQRMVKRVASRTGISKHVTPHVLRHTFSVLCVKRGISTRALMQLLGHERLSTTELYLNLSPEDAIREFETKW